MIVGAVILRQFSKFSYYDIFGIRNQIKIIIRTLSFSVFVVAMINVLLTTIGRKDLSFIWSVGIVGSTSCVSYLEVFYVIKQNNKYLNRGKDNYESVKNEEISARNCCKQRIEKVRAQIQLQKHITDHNKQQDRSQIHSKTKLDVVNAQNASVDDNIIQFKESIKFMKHWSQVVSTPMGYELFINHLAKEFSVETMLFITEVCFT